MSAEDTPGVWRWPNQQTPETRAPTLAAAILACIAEEPGSTPSDVRSMLAERGMRPHAKAVNAALARLAGRGQLIDQPVATGRRSYVHCYRLPPNQQPEVL